MFEEFKERRFRVAPLLKRLVMAVWLRAEIRQGVFTIYSDPNNPKANKL